MRIPNLIYDLWFLNFKFLLWMVTRTRHAVSLQGYPLRTTCSSPLQRDSCLADKLRCVPTALRMIRRTHCGVFLLVYPLRTTWLHYVSHSLVPINRQSSQATLITRCPPCRGTVVWLTNCDASLLPCGWLADAPWRVPTWCVITGRNALRPYMGLN